MYKPGELIDSAVIQEIQEIQDKLSMSTGLSFVTSDYSGKPITKMSNFTKFCKLVRSDPNYFSLCVKSDAHAGIEAINSESVCIHRCHAGLVDFAVPIIVNDRFWGTILGGQIKLPKQDADKVRFIMPESKDIFDNTALYEAYKEINILQYDKIVSIANLMAKMIVYLVEKTTLRFSLEREKQRTRALEAKIKAQSELESALKLLEQRLNESQNYTMSIFNSLNSIACTAISENAENTKALCSLMAESYRYSLKNSDRVNIIKDEAEQVSRFITTQKIKYGDRFDFSLSFDDEILYFKIPGSILPPAVEWIFLKLLSEDKGSFSINGFKEENYIVVQIAVRGVRLSEEQVETLNNALDEKLVEVEEKRVIAARKLLTKHYGERAGISFESKQGVEVIVKYPLEGG